MFHLKSSTYGFAPKLNSYHIISCFMELDISDRVQVSLFFSSIYWEVIYDISYLISYHIISYLASWSWTSVTGCRWTLSSHPSTERSYLSISQHHNSFMEFDQVLSALQEKKETSLMDLIFLLYPSKFKCPNYNLRCMQWPGQGSQTPRTLTTPSSLEPC